MTSLEQYFQQFRDQIIGIDQDFVTPFGQKKLVYTDWTASGRLYRPIEQKLTNEFGPFVANTHTETSTSGFPLKKLNDNIKKFKNKKKMSKGNNSILCICTWLYKYF